MDRWVLSREFFPDYKSPRNPSELERNIQQIIDAQENVVRISPDKAKAIMSHYLEDKSFEEIFVICHKIVNQPARHMLWMLTSANIHELFKKKSFYFRGYEENHIFDYGPDEVKVYFGRIGTLRTTSTFNLFYYLSVIDFAVAESKYVEVNLGEEQYEAETIIKDRLPYVNIVKGGENTIVFRGNRILYRPLATSNAMLEEALIPDLRFAMLPEENDLLSPAKEVIRENLDNPDFDLAELARLLCVSPRTVQRKLQSAGTTFAQLRQEEKVNFLAENLARGNTRQTLAMMAGYKDIDSMNRFITRKVREKDTTR